MPVEEFLSVVDKGVEDIFILVWVYQALVNAELIEDRGFSWYIIGEIFKEKAREPGLRYLEINADRMSADEYFWAVTLCEDFNSLEMLNALYHASHAHNQAIEAARLIPSAARGASQFLGWDMQKSQKFVVNWAREVIFSD
jgi:hypothetical protein